MTEAEVDNLRFNHEVLVCDRMRNTLKILLFEWLNAVRGSGFSSLWGLSCSCAESTRRRTRATSAQG
jgi:hypothetical protein